MLQRALVVLTVFLALLGLAGCNSQSDIYGGQNRPKLYQAIVSLNPNTTEITNLSGMYPGLVGKSTACDFPASITKVKNVVKGTEINYELVKEVNPDLVIYDPALFPDSKLEKLKEMGVTLYPFNPHTYAEYKEQVAKFSQLIGQELPASGMLDKLYSAVQVAKGSIPENGVSSTILIGGGGTEYMAAGTGTCQADFFRQIDLDYKGPEADNFAPVNIETVIGWNPDMIIGTNESAKAILQDPRLANLDAVKNGRVYAVDDEVLLRIGSRVNFLVQAVGQQAQRIYVAKNKTN